MKLLLALVFALGLGGVQLAAAHDGRPLYLELVKSTDNQYQLRWEAPDSVPQNNLPRITPPGNCEASGETMAFHHRGGTVQSQTLTCSGNGWSEGLTISYPRGNPSLSTLARYEGEGYTTTEVLAPSQATWSPPEAQSWTAVAINYARLGIEHIAEGLDHLLFLACLMWIAGTPRRVLITITGFTLAHSVTLILGALELVRVPIPPLEANIALSILFLAVEIVKGRRNSLTWNYPIAVSSAFGLLHGFGFATALRDIGLPQSDMAIGLLFFNIGVEIGQLLIVGAIALTAVALRLLFADQAWGRWRGVGQRLTGYLVGIGAALWFISRTLAFI